MSQSWRKWTRILLAGPGAVLVALVVMAGMPLWLPGGAAGVDNLVLPLVFVPLIWAALFFHACLDRRLSRVAAVAAALFLLHAGLVAHKFLNQRPVAREHRS
ncbi:hypothetical protein MRBLSP13_004242 [Sphingobium sp. LSP13-1-1.1]